MEIFVYLGQYKPTQDFRAIAIFASRSLDPGVPKPCRFLEETGMLIKVYLDELPESPSPSLGLETVQLVMEKQETAISQAGQLISKARSQLKEAALKQKVVELIEIILIYKLPQLSRKELEAMFGLEDLKKTRYFQEIAADYKVEGKLEGKLETIPLLLEAGLTVERIAQSLGLDLELVKIVAKNQSGANPNQN
jgi:predicted transposase/invertase (TIGR01784 family)